MSVSKHHFTSIEFINEERQGYHHRCEKCPRKDAKFYIMDGTTKLHQYCMSHASEFAKKHGLHLPRET